MVERIPSLEAFVPQNDAQPLSMRPETQAVLVHATEATHLAHLAFTRDGELYPSLIRCICEKFMQTVQIWQCFYYCVVLMMQGVVRNLVIKVLIAHPEYQFDLQTLDLYPAPKLTF